MKVAVLIPTYKRQKKLTRCLQSLYDQTYKDFDIFVYFDNKDFDNFITFNMIIPYLPPEHELNLIVNDKQEFVVGSWNKAFKELQDRYDAFLWCVDDVELEPNCLEEAVKCLETNYRDFDGVVGIKQICPGNSSYTFKWYGQCLIGNRFVQRYTSVDYQVCCPAYLHFYQDEELWQYAKSLNRFTNCETAVLKHYHPAFLPEEMDETHPLVRGKVKKQDDATYRNRKKYNWVWGETWEI